MTFPNSGLERPMGPPDIPPENVQDIVPASERNQDPERNEERLALEDARPLTEDERKAADRDTPVGERVYAPASERVPRTIPDYRDVVEHTDAATPERQAAAHTTPPMTEGTSALSNTPTSSAMTGDASAMSGMPTSAPMTGATGAMSSTPTGATGAMSSTPSGATSTPSDAEGGEEPSFTRVPRPSVVAGGSSSSETGSDEYGHDRWMSSSSNRMGMLPMGIGWAVFGVCAGVGVWLWMRWQRERNKPINRLRRQARQTASQARQRASELRDRMPEIDMPDEAARPAVGLGTALLSLAVLLWQQSQARSRSAELESRSRDVKGRAQKASKQASKQADKAYRRAEKASRRAADSLSDVDWQSRLMQLKELWNPSRVELEKVSLPKR